jgi:hypothetical protein
LAVVLPLPSLAACGPTANERMAISLVDDGSVAVSVLLCESRRVSFVTVSDRDDPSQRWRVDNPADEDRPSGAEWFSFTLLEVPTGWTLDDDSLSELSVDREYHLNVAPSGESAYSVDFSLADLQGLDGDDVWVATQRGGRARPRADFERDAAEGCG